MRQPEAARHAMEQLIGAARGEMTETLRQATADLTQS